MPEHKPLYLYSLKEAAEWDEKDEWRESYLENCDCARAIERAIDEHYDGQCLNPCAQEVIARYGFGRVNFVLAATVRQGTHDGRYSEDNKNWARRFSVMDKENTWQYHVRSHPGLVNLFVADARRQWETLGLYDGSQCDSEHSGQLDYTDRILVLRPFSRTSAKRRRISCSTPPTATAAARILSVRRCSDSMCRTEKKVITAVTNSSAHSKRNSSPNGHKKTHGNILKPMSLPTNPTRTAA